MANLTVYLSNYLEELYEAFKENLYLPGDPLTLERLVVVPNAAIGEWLQHRLTADPEVGIAAGLRIVFEDDAFARLAAPRAVVFPTHLQLSMGLEADILHLLHSGSRDPVWQPLYDFLGAGPEPTLSKRSEKRLVALCDKLATLFREYGKQAGRLVASWPIPAIQWQERLWQRLFEQHPHWSYPYKHLEPTASQQPRRVYLFGHIYLCPLYHRFFINLAKKAPVSAFFFSACAEYWADVCSDRESARLLRFHQRQGAPAPQQQALEELLRDRNPLLANIGKVGRKMAAQLDWEEQELESRHQMPEGTSLLAQLQTDLLLLRNPQDCAAGDTSIQIHVAATRLREVEVLYDALTTLMYEKNISPAEIQVLAPDIEIYVPLIKTVFNSCHHHLADLLLFAHDSFTDGFRRLLALAASRWDAPMVLEFLECAPVRARLGLGQEKLAQIRRWIQRAGIVWGIDPAHRISTLKNAHCTQPPVSNHPAGTWLEGLGRLLNGLIYGDEEINDPAIPVSGINWADSVLLSNVLELVHHLKDDLAVICDGTKKSPEDWSAYLVKLCQTYLNGDSEQLFSLFAEFSAAGSHPVPFISIQKRLERAFESKRYVQKASDGQAIRFGSIRSSSGIPAKVVCLIGMEEGAFPMADSCSPLDLRNEKKLVDDLPTPIEQDRQRFLDAILSARCHLLLSYPELNTTDGREQNPSILITELLSYLKRGYGIEPSDMTTRHSFYPFGHEYFAQPNLQPAARYRAAQAYYSTPKDPVHGFFKFPLTIVPEPSDETMVELKDLENAAKNPLKLYCNRALGLYIREDDCVLADEPFVLTALDRYKIKEEAKTKSLSKALQRASANTVLPQGLFGEVASARLQEEFDQIMALVHPDELFSVQFGFHTKEPLQHSPKEWLLPAVPVKVGDRTLHICGRLTNLSSSGWLLHGKGELTDRVKAYPGTLLLAHLPQSLFPNQAILWTGSPKTTPLPPVTPAQLSDFVEYTLACKQNPSPLLPEWIEHFINGNSKKIEKTLKDSRFFNHYAKWGFGNIENDLSHDAMIAWANVAKRLYSFSEG